MLKCLYVGLQVIVISSPAAYSFDAPTCLRIIGSVSASKFCISHCTRYLSAEAGYWYISLNIISEPGLALNNNLSLKSYGNIPCNTKAPVEV